MYFYVVGKDETMIRFCIPFVVGLPLQNKEQLKEAVNDTNKNVKYTKALLSGKDEAKVSLDYDHKITDKESTKTSCRISLKHWILRLCTWRKE